MCARAKSRSYIKEIVLLFLLLAGGFLFRTVFAQGVMPPPARMQGETTQAYRYTKMISDGRSIPHVDSLVNHPVGLNTGENSIFEEYIAGGIHSVIKGDLSNFLLLFCRFFPLLILPILYFWMLNSGFSLPESATGAGLYAVFLPALLRTRGESFYRETVALPFIILCVSMIDMAVRSDKKNGLKLSIGAAIALFVSLASWKVTGFVSFFLFVWLAFKRPGIRIVLPLAASQLLASVVLSHMRHDVAILSPASFMAIAAVVVTLFAHKLIPWFGLLVSLVAGFLFGSSSSGHVVSVITAKLRFFFSHPENPALLSGDTRLFWVSGYTSPALGQIILLFGIALLISVSGWKPFLKKAHGSLMFFLVPLTLAGYLFFDRLHVFLAISLIPLVVAGARGRKWVLPILLTVFGVQSMYAPEIAMALSRTGLEYSSSSSLLNDHELDDLLLWAEVNNGNTLSFWHISGLLSAYADMPVVTHTFFENAENRKTIINFAERIYGTEAEMISFMEESQAEYLVYQADFIFDSTHQGLLYLAALQEIPDGSLAIRLHYYPSSLERLKLVWQGASIRVFQLDGIPTDNPRFPLWESRYASFIYNAEAASSIINMPVETGILFADQGILTSNHQKLSAALLLFSKHPDSVPVEAVTTLLQELLMLNLDGQYSIEDLEEDFVTYLDSWGPDPQIRLDLVRLLRANNLNQRADYHMEIIQTMGRSGI